MSTKTLKIILKGTKKVVDNLQEYENKKLSEEDISELSDTYALLILGFISFEIDQRRTKKFYYCASNAYRIAKLISFSDEAAYNYNDKLTFASIAVVSNQIQDAKIYLKANPIKFSKNPKKWRDYLWLSVFEIWTNLLLCESEEDRNVVIRKCEELDKLREKYEDNYVTKILNLNKIGIVFAISTLNHLVEAAKNFVNYLNKPNRKQAELIEESFYKVLNHFRHSGYFLLEPAVHEIMSGIKHKSKGKIKFLKNPYEE